MLFETFLKQIIFNFLIFINMNFYKYDYIIQKGKTV